MRSPLLAAMVTTLLAGAARADSLHVPADFGSIQDAVDAALPGDEIVVAAGSYEETVEILLKQDLVLRGQGQVVLRGGDGDTATLSVIACTDVRVERLRFDQPAFAAIEVDEGQHVTLARCIVEDSALDGLRVGESSGTVIERCQVLRPAGTAVELVDCEGSLVYRCRVDEPAGPAVAVSGASGTRIERCTLTGAAVNAVTISASTHGSVLRNLIAGAGLGGVLVDGAFADVRDNRLVEAGENAVLVDSGGGASVVADNRIVASSVAGVRVLGSGVAVLRNRVTKSPGFGLLVSGDNPVLEDNVVVAPGDSGIVLSGLIDSGSLGRNRVLHAGDSAFVLGGNGLLVHDNVALGAGLHGFTLSDGPNTLVRNVAKGSGQFDLDDTTGAANVYVDNTFPKVAPPP